MQLALAGHQTLVAQRLKAYDEIWRACVDLQRYANEMLDKPLDEKQQIAVLAKGLYLLGAVNVQLVYVDPEVRSAIEDLGNNGLPEFVKRWTDDPGMLLSRGSFEFLDAKINGVGGKITKRIDQLGARHTPAVKSP